MIGVAFGFLNVILEVLEVKQFLTDTDTFIIYVSIPFIYTRPVSLAGMDGVKMSFCQMSNYIGTWGLSSILKVEMFLLTIPNRSQHY